MRPALAIITAASALTLAVAPPAFAGETLIGEVSTPPLPVQADPASLPDMSTLAWRHGQLTLHQGFGLATLASMAVTGGLGYYSANVDSTLKPAHFVMAGLTTGFYATTATLALTVPPRVTADSGNFWDTISIHKNLGWLHAAGMVATLGLGIATEYTPLRSNPLAHGIAAYSTLGLMALSAGVVAFGE